MKIISAAVRKILNPSVPWSSTPGKLRLGIVMTLILSAVWCIVSVHEIRKTQLLAEIFGRDIAPRLVSLKSLRANLISLDESASHDFLTGGIGNDQARIAYENVLTEAVTHLMEAGRGRSDQSSAVASLMAELTNYNSLIGRARANNRLGLPVGESYLRLASTKLHDTMLPKLDQIEAKEKESLSQLFESQRPTAGIVIGGGVLVGLLIVLQVYVSIRTRRTGSIPLFLSTIIVIVAFVWSDATLTSSKQWLNKAKQESFIAYVDLWTAKSLAIDAKGDLSLFLIARGTGQAYEKSLVGKLEQLGISHDNTGRPFWNISLFSNDERYALDQATTALQKWSLHAAMIRQQQRDGQVRQSVEAALSLEAGSASKLFESFNESITTAVDSSRVRFEYAINQAVSSLPNLLTGAIAAAFTACVLACVGLNLRAKKFIG